MIQNVAEFVRIPTGNAVATRRNSHEFRYDFIPLMLPFFILHPLSFAP